MEVTKDRWVELGFTAPHNCIGYLAPFRKKLVGCTSHLHRDKNMGYGSNNFIPVGESNYCALLARPRPRGAKTFGNSIQIKSDAESSHWELSASPLTSTMPPPVSKAVNIGQFKWLH